MKAENSENRGCLQDITLCMQTAGRPSISRFAF